MLGANAWVTFWRITLPAIRPIGLDGSTGDATPPVCFTSCAEAGANCGPVGDGCGGTIDCGMCVAPQTCGGGGTANLCGGGVH